MPGPLLTVTVAESARQGAKAGPLLVAGHGLLEAALVAAIALGIGPFIARQGVVAGISLVGGGFLLWMGATILRDAVKGRVSLDLTTVGEGSNSALNAGMGRLIGLGAGVLFANLGLGAMPVFRFGGAAGGMKPIFHPQDLASVWGLSLLLSVAAGLYPAWRASGLEPVVALRKE